MVVSNPREPLLWTPRTQEFTGGFNPREVLDHDINPNEDGDGLSHHSRQTPEDGESHDQQDPQKRRQRAIDELAAKIPHVSIKPEKIDDVLGRSPMMEQEQRMLESGMVDMNRGGMGLSAGANVGSVRSEGPNVKFGTQNSVVPFMLGKSIFDNYVRCDDCGRKLSIDPFETVHNRKKRQCAICAAKARGEKTVAMKLGQEEYAQRMQDMMPFDHEWQEKNTSEDDPFDTAYDSILKARRKYKGRRYTDDEESDEEERKAKKKNKRRKKRGKKGVKSARGGRQPKSATKRRSAAVQLQLDRESRHQAFHPNVRSHALRNLGATRSEGIPLRLRDPVAWERKKAYERMRRAQGSLPRGLTQHADTRGTGKLGMTIGGTKGTSTKLPTVSRMGTSTKPKRISRDAAGDPLGTSDPLLAKSKGGLASITRSEFMNMKRKIEALMRKLNKLTKATPELDNAAKVGSVVNGDEASSPEGATTSHVKGEPPYRFIDRQAATEIGLVGKY